MQPSADDVTKMVRDAIAHELESAVGQIKHCTGQLTTEQLWRRPVDEMNSIANLILHVCGNLRQWITAGVGGAADTRNRPQEFAERGPIATEELLHRLDAAVAEAKAAMAAASTSELLKVRRIQGVETNRWGAILHSAAHLRGHTQEIVHITRCQLGDDYQFSFVPKTPEQGAATDC